MSKGGFSHLIFEKKMALLYIPVFHKYYCDCIKFMHDTGVTVKYTQFAGVCFSVQPDMRLLCMTNKNNYATKNKANI